MKSYCVKQKKVTECVPSSERHVKTKNNRTMLKCTCAECGIIKSKLVKARAGGSLDIQKQLAKFGELHMRTPTGKKYKYCGPGTKLDERLASNNPKYRDPINKLDAVCQKHDIDYSNSTSLKDKHTADKLMLDRISQIPYSERPWGTTAVQGMISAKRKLGLGVSKAERAVE